MVAPPELVRGAEKREPALQHESNAGAEQQPLAHVVRHEHHALAESHDVREGLLLGSAIGLLQEGQIVFLGTPDEFRRSEHPACRAFLAAAG